MQQKLLVEMTSFLNINLNASLFLFFSPQTVVATPVTGLPSLDAGSSPGLGRFMRYSDKESGKETVLPFL